jgi:hypothetical protein
LSPAQRHQNVNRILDSRIWRVRRRGQWIDATLAQTAGGWGVTFTRNGRPLATLEFDTREEAVAAATARRREFERAGWTEHW